MTIKIETPLVYSAKAHTIVWWAPLSALLLLTTFNSSLLAADKLDIWPNASLTGLLTDNLPQQTTSSARSDAISLVNLGISATIDANNRTFGLDYSTDAQVYARNSSHNQAFQDQYVGLHDYERISALTGLSLNDTFINGQQTFGQSLIGSSATTPLLSQALQQNNFLANSFNLQLSHELSEQLSTLFSVHQTLFFASDSQPSESFSQGGELAAYYVLGARFSVGPDLQFNDFRFSNQPRTDSFQPSLGVTWSGSEHLVTSARIGPLIFSSPAGTSIDLGYTLRTSYRGERWLLNLSGGRMPSISAGVSGAAVSQYEGATAQYWISRWTSIYINGSFNQFSQTGTNSYIVVYGSGINHQLTRSTAIFAQFIRFQTNSPSLNENAADTLTFGIKFTPRPWEWTF
ncbi:MAG: hypothetical protein JO189_25735 [Deltaproteobacteria bacterium]|nr:hypothetical protein [Deltaproteobacteria bacterium]